MNMLIASASVKEPITVGETKPQATRKSVDNKKFLGLVLAALVSIFVETQIRKNLPQVVDKQQKGRNKKKKTEIFPTWLRINHYINLICVSLLIRSGIQILGSHPRLYWNDDCAPGTEWIRFTKRDVPLDVIYTARQDEVMVPSWLGIPGGKSLGAGRHWHFFTNIIWVSNGLLYVSSLIVTGHWKRLIPTSFSVIPRALHTLADYLAGHRPAEHEFRPYDALQQLTYGAVIFLLAPFMALTGIAMSPALAARFPKYVKFFGGHQAARSLHFFGMVAFISFILVHILMVLIVDIRRSIQHIVLGHKKELL